VNRSKLASLLARRIEQVAPSDRLPIIVEFGPEGRSARAIHEFVRAMPVQRLFHLVPSVAMEASPREIASLSQDERVERIWLDRRVQAFLDGSVPLVQAPQVWELGYTGRGVRIAILDSGVDANHPDLRGRVAAAKDFTSEGLPDLSGHGTLVAGVAAGDGHASRGRYRGVAPQASILSAKVLSRDGSGLTSQVMAGLEWALEEGAEVANISLGNSGPADGRDPLSRACDAAVEKGMVVCVAGGNTGPARASLGIPAAGRQVIAVGASDDEDAVPEFSARGPTSDGRPKPDLLAPGVGIVSLRAQGTSQGRPLDPFYASGTGTSLAAAHVSGAVALLLQAYPRLSPAQVREALWISAWSLGQPPETQGGGRLDALGAFKVAQRPRKGGWLAPLGWLLGRR